MLGITWECVDISDDAINRNCSYILINKEMEWVSKNAVEELNSKDVILVFPSQRKNNTTVRVMKTPKTESSVRKIYIPRYVAELLAQIKKEQDEIREALGDSGHAQADMITEVYGHIMDEDRIRNAQRMEKAFYNKENLNPDIHGQVEANAGNMVAVPEGIDAEALMKVLGNPEMAALLAPLAKTVK
jgi:hypothetical protein